MREIQYYDLPTQTNIYNSCTFSHKNRVNLLVAAGKDVYCTYSADTIDGNVRWHQVPISPPYITQDNEIISIDCYDESESHQKSEETQPSSRTYLNVFHQHSNPILAVTTIKTDKKTDDGDVLGHIHFFGGNNSSSYSQDDIAGFSSALNRNKLSIAVFSNADSAHSIELNFLPFKVARVKFHGKKGKAFVLAGSDRFHVYVQDSSMHKFQEVNIVDYFSIPKLSSSIISFDIKYYNSKTFLVFGCQDGYIHLLSPGSEIESQGWHSDGPISSVALFTDTLGTHCHNLHPSIALLNRNVEQHNPLAIFSNKEFVHLIAADAIGQAIYFRYIKMVFFVDSRHVNQQGLKDRFLLPESDKHDSVVAVLVADVDFDGKNEIVIGTYSQQVLVYKDREGLTTVPSLKKNEYYLYKEFTFNKPIMSLHWADLCQDGVDNLIVVTALGIHILQCDMKQVVEKTIKFLDTVKEIKQLESSIEIQMKRQEELSAKIKPGRRLNPFKSDSFGSASTEHNTTE